MSASAKPRTRWRVGVVALLWAIGVSPVAQAQPPEPVPVDGAPVWQEVAGVHQTTLPNGFTLWVRPDRRAPTAVHMLWVRVGSMDEVDGTSGVAHVLEHMMFKGTPRLKPGEYSRRVAALGGRDNAFTSRDTTAYHQQVPAQHLETVMALEADRFAHNTWSDDEFRREMEVIKEERRQRIEDQPSAQLWEALSATAHLAHPYRRPVIGWMSDLEALTPDDVRAFHRRWYVPGNAAIVVAGDVEPDAVYRMAMRHYGPIPPGTLPRRHASVEPDTVGRRHIQVRAAAERPTAVLAFRAPRLSDPAAHDTDSQEALALLLLGAVLDGYDGARLGRQLVQGAGGPRVADQVDAGYSGGGRGPALFVLGVSPAPDRTVDEAVTALRAEVQRVIEHGVTDAELARARTQWQAAEVYKLDSVFAQAQQMGSQWVNGWSPDAGTRTLQSLSRVTPAQVQSAARRWLVDAKLTQAELVPDTEALAQRRQAVGTRPRLDTRH